MSEDLQIYLRCESCLREYRMNPSIAISSIEAALKSHCRVDDAQLLAIRHLNIEPRICLDCISFEEFTDQKCPRCGSRNSSPGYRVDPPFPETFGQITLPEPGHTWGADADADISVIRREVKICAMFPEGTLYQIPLAMLADRLSRRKYRKGNTVELRNLAATILRYNYQQTGNISAGVTALQQFLECIDLAKSVMALAIYEYNAATAANSLLVKQQAMVLAVTDFGNTLRDLGLQLADDSLRHYAELNLEPDKDPSPRVHWLIGDLYFAGLALEAISEKAISDEELRHAWFHYDAALRSSAHMSEADLAYVRHRRDQVISLYSQRHDQPPPSSEPQTDAVLDAIDWRRHSDNYLLLLERARSLRRSDPKKALRLYEAATALTSERLSMISDSKALALMADLFVSVNEEFIEIAGERKQAMKTLAAMEAVRGVAVRAGSSSDTKRELQNYEVNLRHFQLLLRGEGESGTLEDAIERSKRILCRIEDELRGSSQSLLPRGRVFVAMSVSHGLVTAVLAKISGWPERLRSTVYQWAVPEGTSDVLIERHQFYNEMVGPFRERRLAKLVDAASSVFATKLLPILREQSAVGIVLSAPGWLSHLPYESLRVSAQATSVLADSFEISYLPSLLLGRRVLERTGTDATEEPRLLVVPYAGDDLPESIREVEFMRHLWGRNMTVLSVTDCNKLDVLTELGKPYSHIHFACHGTFDPIFPLRSSLLLWGARDEDRYKITASEILQVKMPAAPVVSLSACSSGITAYGKTNDLTGLTGSFLQAGAKGVVGSRWPVYDHTAASFMTHYYSLILEGKTSLRAVHESQRKMRQDGGHLEDWATFGYLGICEEG